jgi:hypothetical protein
MKWSDAHQLKKLGGARAGAGEGGVIAAPDLDDNPGLCLPLSEIPGVIIRLSSVSQGST